MFKLMQSITTIKKKLSNTDFVFLLGRLRYAAVSVYISYNNDC